MEDAGAQFVAIMIDRVHALEEKVLAQQEMLQKPCLVSGSICSDQMAFCDGTAIHWALGRPPEMYPLGGPQVPLAAPYGDVKIAKGPHVLFVCDKSGFGFYVRVSADTGFVSLHQFIDKVNGTLNERRMLAITESFANRSAWQLRQTPFGWCLKVHTDVPPGD